MSHPRRSLQPTNLCHWYWYYKGNKGRCKESTIRGHKKSEPLYNINSGALTREARASRAPFVNKSTHPRKIGNHLTVHRTNDHPSAPQAYQCQSHTFWQVWEHRKTDIAHILHINVVINWQLSKQGVRWPVSPDRIAGSGVHPSRSSIFLKLSVYQLLVFKWS